MRILYLHQYFNTPDMVGSTRSYEMGRRLVAAGHEVHVITSLRDAAISKAKSAWKTTAEAGINVHWFPVPYSNAMGKFERISAFLKFADKAASKAIELGGDLIFATSTPLTIAIPALRARRKLKVPMVFEVRDLWPDAPIQMKQLTNPVMVAMARRLEKSAYKNSAHIVALTPGMVDGVAATGVSRDHISMIPNCSDLDVFHPNIDGSPLRQSLSLDGKFIASYFGTIGPANGLGYVLDAAADLKARGENNITIIIQGDGKEKPALIERKASEGLDNLIFLDPVPKADVAKLAAASDVCMTIFKNVPVLQTCSPNKLFDSFAAGKPVVTNMPGWLESLAVDEDTGLFVEPDNARALADKLVWLRDHPEDCARFAKHARALAESRFSRDQMAEQLLNDLERVHAEHNAAK